MLRLCELACQYSFLDLCRVDPEMGDVFPMLWRFFPTLDPGVDVVMSRDRTGDLMASGDIRFIDTCLSYDKTDKVGGTWSGEESGDREGDDDEVDDVR